MLSSARKSTAILLWKKGSLSSFRILSRCADSRSLKLSYLLCRQRNPHSGSQCPNKSNSHQPNGECLVNSNLPSTLAKGSSTLTLECGTLDSLWCPKISPISNHTMLRTNLSKALISLSRALISLSKVETFLPFSQLVWKSPDKDSNNQVTLSLRETLTLACLTIKLSKT